LEMVVRFLFVPRVRFHGEGANRLDAALDDRCNETLCARCRTSETLQVFAWHFAHARDRRALGNSGSDSNTRRILQNWNWKTRHTSIIWSDGRPRGKFVRRLFASAAVLFRHPLRQLFSLVNQAAGTRKTTLAQLRQDRHLPPDRGGDHFSYLQFD